MYVRIKLISRVKHTENISFPEARRRVENSQPSYATVAASPTHPKAPLVTSSTLTDHYWPEDADLPSSSQSIHFYNITRLTGN